MRTANNHEYPDWPAHTDLLLNSNHTGAGAYADLGRPFGICIDVVSRGMISKIIIGDVTRKSAFCNIHIAYIHIHTYMYRCETF